MCIIIYFYNTIATINSVQGYIILNKAKLKGEI